MDFRRIIIVLTLLSCLSWSGVLGQETSKNDSGLDDLQLANLPAVVGLFDHWDEVRGRFYIGLDKDRRKLEEIDFRRIRAVDIIQGNHEKLLGYLAGGAAAGGGMGFSSLFVKKKWLGDDKNAAASQWETKETAFWIAGGATIGFLLGWLKDRGEEDVRAFRVYDIDARLMSSTGSKRNLQDRSNLGRILPGTIVHVATSSPEP